MSIQNRISEILADWNFFQIYIETKIGNIYDDVLSTDELKKIDRDKIIRVNNGDGILTPENWNNLKDVFFIQRMERHKNSYTQKEKIKLELDYLERLPINETDYKILKDRYKTYLDEVLTKKDNIKEYQQSSKGELYLTVFERIMRELNVIAWAFECQFMEASKSVIETPMLHSKGRYLTGMYFITSNVEMLKLQYYITYYTNRFENTNNHTLLKRELLKISEKANNVLQYYNDNLTAKTEIVKKFQKNIPQQYKARSKYLEIHKGRIITHDLNPQHIVFAEDCKHPDWKESNFNYGTSNNELALFCQKLIDFIKDFEIQKTLPPDQPNFTFTNNFDKAEPPSKVYEYFNNTLVSKGYLSEEDLKSYLISAFQNETPPKEKITFSDRHIGNITSIFYKYYADADNKHGKQEDYAELLGEYFKGFSTQKVMNNFAKSK